jgi:hypothetical protein
MVLLRVLDGVAWDGMGWDTGGIASLCCRCFTFGFNEQFNLFFQEVFIS